jgi:putative CocE/NonD family hydrolase
MAQERKGVSIRKNLLIPLHDGVSLAADLVLPDGEGPFPTLVSYYPYHKDDFIGVMLEYPMRYFAEQGYAHLLVDFRGLGNSGGVAWEALDPQENKDGAEIVEWAAKQPWCDGNLGMWGISYGGVTSLETASERPPHLKAIVPIYASVDVYHDFIYPGGCQNCLSVMGAWGSFMVAMNLMPPGYQDPEGRWYEVWKERLEKGKPHVMPWQDHPAYDEYWKSRVTPIENITAATMVIGGGRARFPERAVRLYEHLSAPKKLMVGPWTHILPDLSPFEPWDYLYEMKRWWDYWLKGEQNGIMAEPRVTLFVQGSNVWKQELEWPIARSEERTLFLLDEGALAEFPPKEQGSHVYQANPAVGTRAGLWDPISLGIGTPLDQGPDDLQSLTYTSDALLQDLEITGSPQAVFYAALAEGEEVNLVAKLSSVGADGSSSLITTGWLKGSHCLSHERPEPLKPGQVYEFTVPLWAASYLVPKGNRLRLSVSCADFPHLWPTKTNPRIRLFFGGSQASRIRIPVVPPPAAAAGGAEIRRPDPAVNRFPSVLEAVPKWGIEHDLVSGAVAVTTGNTEHFRVPSGGIVHLEHNVRASVTPSRPDGAKLEGETVVEMDLPATGKVRVEGRTLISQSRLLITGAVKVGGRVFFEKQWLK